MPEVLHNLLHDFSFQQVVLAFIGVVVTVFFGIFAFQRARKELRYEILCNEPLFKVRDGDESRRITVYFDNVLVTDVRVLIIKLINCGAVAIKKEDQEENIHIYIGENAEIFNIDISEECPSGLISNELIEIVENKILKLKSILLNGGDYFSIKITGSKFDEEIKVKGRIVDIKEIKKIERKSLGKKIERKYFLYIVIGMAIYFLMYLAKINWK